jgi:hypothetical protein
VSYDSEYQFYLKSHHLSYLDLEPRAEANIRI